ncbi:TetR/AcrR family transcriptional regulator [Rothia sp. P5764]|uniref:TetR/AcrR family transcriptional regulator n=1 Tax=unclassified Rothia (in: high G+C Gram-positive bacteria) TaxID=2689056 RepID=UPI003ACFA354
MNTSAQETRPAPSARQRRRQRTHAAIHGAALDLVADKGFKAATTDEIAQKAGVSPRTLFNYFAAKEDAVLGLRPPVLTDQILEQDQTRKELYIFERIAHLLVDILVTSIDGPSYPQLRLLLDTYPELRFRMRTHHLACENVLADFLRSVDWQAFSQQGRKGPFIYRPCGSPTPLREHNVQAALCITSALLRYIDLTQGIPDGPQRDTLIREAVSTFRHLLREDTPTDPPSQGTP